MSECCGGSAAPRGPWQNHFLTATWPRSLAVNQGLLCSTNGSLPHDSFSCNKALSFCPRPVGERPPRINLPFESLKSNWLASLKQEWHPIISACSAYQGWVQMACILGGRNTGCNTAYHRVTILRSLYNSEFLGCCEECDGAKDQVLW